jgi:hypothetical protein
LWHDRDIRRGRDEMIIGGIKIGEKFCNKSGIVYEVVDTISQLTCIVQRISDGGDRRVVNVSSLTSLDSKWARVD